MNSRISTGKTPLAIYLIIIVLPFLMFYWMMPFVTNTTLGKDYQEFSIQTQMELLFSIKNGSFPLYVPGFALGHSSSALMLGEIYHPISHITSILPGYWEGKALQWNTFFRLLSLGLTHLALFVFLRKIRLNTLFSFLLSCITVYNLRTLDLFRFGASLEAYTGYLLLCTAIGLYFLKPTKWLMPVCIIGATYWLVCSGHPPVIYYCFIGIGLFLLVAPFFISVMLPDKQIVLRDILTFWLKCLLYIALGILLSSAFILPLYFDFIKENTSRIAQSYEFSLGSETFFGTLNNFFIPFYSEVHGAFGGSFLFLMAAILPILRCFKVRIPCSVWVIWGFMLFAFIYMQGERTPVHRWVWEYLPFASSMRGEGRISIIIPIFIMMILAWIINIKSFPLSLRWFSITLTPHALLALTALLLIPLYIIYAYYMGMELASFTPRNIHDIPLWKTIIITLCGVASLIALFSYSTFPRSSNTLGIFLCLITCIHIGSILQHGTFITERHDQPTFEDMKSQKKTKPGFLYNPGAGMYSSTILSHLDRSFLEPFSGKIYTRIIPVSSQNDAYDSMEHQRLPQQIFVEGYQPEKAQSVTEEMIKNEEGKVDLIYSSFNRLKFSAISSSPAFFGMSYPYTRHWRAWVNGNKVPVYRANGAAHAVEIPKGESLIEFRYRSPSAFWGMIISCSTFILIGLFICYKALNGLPRMIIVVFVLTIGVGGAITWNYSLYTGDNLGTEYTWTYTPPKPKPNLAYGKKTKAFPVHTDNFYFANSFFRTHWSKAVDGNRSPGSGYIMNLKRNPAVIIDLYQREKINSIVLYESIIKEPLVNGRHLELSISQDEKQWNKVTSMTSKVNNHHPIRVEFDSPKTARYVQIKASGHGRLSIDEVEVY